MTIFNKRGKPYTLEGVYCRHCIEASSGEENEEPISSITTKPVEVHDNQVNGFFKVAVSDDSFNVEETQASGVSVIGTSTTTNTPESSTNGTSSSDTQTPSIPKNGPASSANTQTPESSKPLLTNKTDSTVSSYTIFKSLLWVHNKLVFCDWKRLIFPVVLVVIFIGVVKIASLLTRPPYHCADGSYAEDEYACIDNNDPPGWKPSYDFEYFTSRV